MQNNKHQEQSKDQFQEVKTYRPKITKIWEFLIKNLLSKIQLNILQHKYKILKEITNH